MAVKVFEFPYKNLLRIALVIVMLLLGFLIYDSKEPFVKPLFTKQVDAHCPYYKDFLGRVFYRYSYYPSSLFIIGPVEKKMQYNWHRVKGIDNKSFEIEKVLQETRVNPSAETQKVCIASDGNNLIYNNYVFTNADVESFEKLENSFYKDRNTVYFSNGRVVPEADPQTFEVLMTDECFNSHPPFARDKYKVFYADNVIEQADRDTFGLICVESGVRGKDKNHTYLDFRTEN